MNEPNDAGGAQSASPVAERLEAPSEGPTCARHASQAASRTCSRCGAFACDACLAQSDAQICADCLVRGGAVFPYWHDDAPILGILRWSGHAFLALWAPFSAGVIILTVLSFLGMSAAEALARAGADLLRSEDPESTAGIAQPLLRLSHERKVTLLKAPLSAALGAYAALGLANGALRVLRRRSLRSSDFFVGPRVLWRSAPVIGLQAIQTLTTSAWLGELFAGVVTRLRSEADAGAQGGLGARLRALSTEQPDLWWALAGAVLLYLVLDAVLSVAFTDLLCEPDQRAIARLKVTATTSLRDWGRLVLANALATALGSLSVLALCVGFIPGAAICSLFLTGFVLALRTPAPDDLLRSSATVMPGPGGSTAAASAA